mmetsp:Transcript_39338/g.82532  ORF Transcript_39338/g.82532 Transcript_39338/m.82532 type:complete len:183 (-) Transcript_39338:706-1254(-)|eukprot:6188154-Pleurochrysis_carterae.AAC.1
MLSGGSKPLAPLGAPPEQFEPEPEDLRLPDGALEGVTASGLLRAVQRVQESRLELHVLLEDRYEELVTQGKADEYPTLVERFNAKYAVCSENLEALASALAAASQPKLGERVRQLRALEDSRQPLWLEVQVLRQHMSMTSPDDPMKKELEVKLAKARIAVQEKIDSINETLEELRCEAADLD